jgi:O-acetyl-ADP-ribose deacetylase (regulator of RNase III)
MPLNVIRQDITKVKADAIVNTANPKPVIGGGTDSAIYEAAGMEELLALRKKIGDIAPGDAVETDALALSAQYIIHTVGPVWRDGKYGEAAVLKACYDNSLALAKRLGCKSIAFPLIATGSYGFPKDKAIEIATHAINSFLEHNDMKITLVLFDKESFVISGPKFKMIMAYIDQNYVEEKGEIEYASDVYGNYPRDVRIRRNEIVHLYDSMIKVPDDIGEYLDKSDTTFRDRILAIMDERGLKSTDVYKKQHLITKKVYSDFKNDKYYHPNKYTAVAFCLALELDLDQTLEIMNSAGWTLSPSRKEDLIVRWHIARGDYSIRNINASLTSFGYKNLEQYKS